MTVYDIMELFVDSNQMIEIYDNNEDDVIYKGFYTDLSDEIAGMEVASIDNIYEENKGCITFNVN